MHAPQWLKGVRVLDLSRLLPGPYLTMVLADLGADVVKVEDTGVGDYLRQLPPTKHDLGGRFLAVNRNKRSVALDLKSDPGRAAFVRMAAQADVVVETFRPGVMDRLGIGAAQLRQRNPRLIVCSVSGFGQTGPYRQRPGHDLNYIGLTGMLAMTGTANLPPQIPGLQVADMAGGGLWGVIGILGALYGREHSERGCELDISMTEGVLSMMGSELGSYDAGGGHPTRGKEGLNGGLASYSVYETKDHKFLSVGALEPKFWIALNEILDRKPNMSELLPSSSQQAVYGELAAVFASRTQKEWVDALAGSDVCVEPILEVSEVLNCDLHLERSMFFYINDPDLGPVLQVRTPLGLPERRGLAPRHGEHTAQVLREYGLSGEEIAQLSL